MKLFKYVVSMMVVFGLAYLPLILSKIEPMKTSIENFVIVGIDNQYFTIRFSGPVLIELSPVVLSIIGMFIIVCVYSTKNCAWRKERLKENEFIQKYINDDLIGNAIPRGNATETSMQKLLNDFDFKCNPDLSNNCPL